VTTIVPRESQLLWRLLWVTTSTRILIYAAYRLTLGIAVPFGHSHPLPRGQIPFVNLPVDDCRAGEGGSIPCYLCPTSTGRISEDAPRLTHNDRPRIASQAQRGTLRRWHEPLNRNKLILLLCSHLLLRIYFLYNPISYIPSFFPFTFLPLPHTSRHFSYFAHSAKMTSPIYPPLSAPECLKQSLRNLLSDEPTPLA
jgi:hypothetical protein